MAAVSLVACVHTGRLGEYDFRDRFLAVVTTAPPHPEVFTGDWFMGGEQNRGILGVLFRVGSEVAREVQAERARERLDQASRSVDVSGIMADRVLQQTSRLLRAVPVESARDADFEAEVQVQRYGIEASGWDSQASFFLNADLFLIDAETGTEIWRAEVDANAPVRPNLTDTAPGMGPMLTATALASLSVEEMEATLLSLAEFGADAVTEKLREALRKVRGG